MSSKQGSEDCEGSASLTQELKTLFEKLEGSIGTTEGITQCLGITNGKWLSAFVMAQFASLCLFFPVYSSAAARCTGILPKNFKSSQSISIWGLYVYLNKGS